VNRATRAQEQTLALIASMTLIRGRAPTQGELADALGITRQAAGERLAWMRKKGLVRVRHDRWSRSSGLTYAGVAVVAHAISG
jgi:DNA-binding transcriptional regulator LsrR (DeoR family)